MYKREYKGYMTIEASLILPMIIGGIVFLIYLGIGLYNVNVINHVAYIAALRGSQLADMPLKAVKTYVEEQAEELLDAKILGEKILQTKVKVSYGKIKVKINMDSKIPFKEWDLFKIEREAEVNRTDPVDFIRKVRLSDEGQISK